MKTPIGHIPELSFKMHTHHLTIIAVFVLAFGVFSCVNPPDFDIVPRIEFISISKDTMDQGFFQEDTIQIMFSFEDGDGDIGRMEDALENNIFLTDTRTGLQDNSFGIPFIPPQGSDNGIEGEIRVLIYSTCCIYENGLDPCAPSTQFPFDSVTYEIYIVDRAGNKSNVIETSPIILRCN